MLRLAILILAINLLFGCSAPKTSVQDSPELQLENVHFQDSGKDYVFKTEVEIYGNSVSGLIIIKKLEDHRHRLVFTTDFGNSLMDLEFNRGQVQLLSAVKEWNRKRIIRIMKEDFGPILLDSYHGFLDDEVFVYRDGNHRMELITTDGKITQMRRLGKQLKTTTSLELDNQGEIQKIVLSHEDIPLRFSLLAIKN